MNNTGESNYCCRGWARNGRMSAIINCIISVEDISRQRNCHPCRSPAKQMATKTIHKFARWGAGGDDRRPRMRGPLAFCSANARQKQFSRKEKESKFEPMVVVVVPFKRVQLIDRYYNNYDAIN